MQPKMDPPEPSPARPPCGGSGGRQAPGNMTVCGLNYSVTSSMKSLSRIDCRGLLWHVCAEDEDKGFIAWTLTLDVDSLCLDRVVEVRTKVRILQ